MTCRVSSENKEKKPKGKIVFKKRDQTGKKNGTNKQKTASQGVEPCLSARARNLGALNDNFRKKSVRKTI